VYFIKLNIEIIKDIGMESNNSVLIIDDDYNIVNLISYILVKAGIKVFKVYSGSSACKWLEENTPNLILCDILMPELSGMEVLDYIKKMDHLKNIPVLAVTALAMTGYKEKLLRHGFDAYFSKPINIHNFASQVMPYLKSYQREAYNDKQSAGGSTIRQNEATNNKQSAARKSFVK
jgi:two-component system, cell cycle response regulator DivK